MARLPFLQFAVWIVALVAAALVALYLVVDNTFNGSLLSRWRQRVEHARTHTVLNKPQVLDGVLFPAGAEIAWADSSHRRMAGASLPRAAEILGVRTTYLRRDGEGGWIIAMLDARELDSWPCAKGQVQLTAAGRLQDCVLSGTPSWQGWTLPERTSVSPLPSINAVRLTLPFRSPLDMPLESPVVGRLPWAIVLNDDGSPSAAGYDREAPHRVTGQELAGDVRWEYDPATYGMGRERPPVTVEGFVYDPRGEGMSGARRHVVLPWPGSMTKGRKEGR